MALRLASRLALGGVDARPSEVARNGVTRVVQSPETRAMIEGLRSQVMEAFQAALDARVNQVAQQLTDRTQQLKSVGAATGDAAEQATGTVADVAGSLTGGEEPEEPEEQESDQAQVEEEPEAEEQEGQPGDEGEEESPESSGIEERVAQLKRKRIAELRNMAVDLFEDEEEIDGASKDDLARWIAEAEADDETEDAEEEEEAEEPARSSVSGTTTGAKTSKKAPSKKSMSGAR